MTGLFKTSNSVTRGGKVSRRGLRPQDARRHKHLHRPKKREDKQVNIQERPLAPFANTSVGWVWFWFWLASGPLSRACSSAHPT